MPKVLHISVSIELPADEWEEAEAKVAIKPVYDGLVVALQNAGFTYEHRCDTSEVRARRSDIGKPRARKQAADRPPRLVPPPQDAA